MDIFTGTGLTHLIVVFIVGLLIFVLGGFIVWWYFDKKRFWIHIPLYKNIGNVPTRVRTYKAKLFPIGKAGDYLWFVKGVKKYLPPATLQSAPNEYMHWEREDGEWINFVMGDLDEDQKRAGVKYIHQDMRSQRIATANLLEQRLMQKGFWEKWGVVIGYVIFFLVITVAVVINLYMMGRVIQEMKPLVEAINTGLNKIIQNEQGGNSIIPAMALIFFRKFKGGFLKNFSRIKDGLYN